MKISKREMIILGLTLLALIYAGVFFLFSTPDGAISPSETDEDSTHGFVMEIAQSLTRNHLTETEQSILEKTQVPWPPQPFITGGLPSSANQMQSLAQGPEDNPDEFSFTGYVKIGSRRLAIINSEEYETGDRITGSPYTVRSISPGQVLLGDSDNRMRPVPMAGSVDRNAASTSQQSE